VVPALKPIRIVLVEPHRLIRDLLVRALQTETCQVVGVDSPGEARKFARWRSSDLFVVDAEIEDSMKLIDDVQARKLKVIALIQSDRTRELLRPKKVPVVDKRGSLTALGDAIRSAVGIDGGLETERPRVLIVDDEESTRQILSEFLEGRGYATATSADGMEALETIDLKPDIRVVLLDINMPRMGGMEALREIVRRKPHPTVVMMTALADREIATQAVKLGAFDYLLKPPDLNIVQTAISAGLSHFEYKWKV
jgi:DNA-binding NtrC family response regulator